MSSFQNNHHYTRLSILPCYPTDLQETHANLLLANIPSINIVIDINFHKSILIFNLLGYSFRIIFIHLDQELNNNELQRRLLYGYHRPTAKKPINDHQRLLFFLSGLWNVEVDILEFNFQRMMTLANRLAMYRMEHFSTSFNEESIHEEEFSTALEFYLQIDINLFYMKTCSYRDAKFLTYGSNRNLFCAELSEAHYSMTPCHQHTCCLCYPSYQLTYRSHQPIVIFGPHQQHQFINGYRSILNCSASCTTKNIIYVLTCPCQKVDYIGETS